MRCWRRADSDRAYTLNCEEPSNGSHRGLAASRLGSGRRSCTSIGMHQIWPPPTVAELDSSPPTLTMSELLGRDCRAGLLTASSTHWLMHCGRCGPYPVVHTGGRGPPTGVRSTLAVRSTRIHVGQRGALVAGQSREARCFVRVDDVAHVEPFLRPRVRGWRLLFVGGGNTFRLLDLAPRSGLLEPVRHFVAAGRDYHGGSARGGARVHRHRDCRGPRPERAWAAGSDGTRPAVRGRCTTALHRTPARLGAPGGSMLTKPTCSAFPRLPDVSMTVTGT